MKSIFLKQLLFVSVFALCNLILFSISSTFHNVLGYDINTLEEWLYHNRLFLITIAKLLTLAMFMVPAGKEYSHLTVIKKKFQAAIQQFLKIWKLDSKIWILQIIGCLFLYALFFDIKINENADLYSNTLQQIVFCLIFWSCDVIFVRKLYADNIFIKYEHHRLINAGLQSASIVLSAAIVTYLSWFDLLQFYLVLTCMFYLLQSDTSIFSGYFTLMVFFVISSLFHPLNFIINSEEIKFYLIAEGFSLPWSFIFLSYYLLFLYLNPYCVDLYHSFISKTKKS